MNNTEWVYRCIYGCHYLMSKCTNEIISISPVIGQLFEKYQGNVHKWAKENNVSDEDKNVLVTYLLRKGIINETHEI